MSWRFTAVMVFLAALGAAAPVDARDRYNRDRDYLELSFGGGGAAGVAAILGPTAGAVAALGFGLNFSPWIGMTLGVFGLPMWELPQGVFRSGAGLHLDLEFMQARPGPVDLYAIFGGQALWQDAAAHDGVASYSARAGGGADVFLFEMSGGEWVFGARVVVSAGVALGRDGHVPLPPLRADVLGDLHVKWHFRLF